MDLAEDIDFILFEHHVVGEYRLYTLTFGGKGHEIHPLQTISLDKKSNLERNNRTNCITHLVLALKEVTPLSLGLEDIYFFVKQQSFGLGLHLVALLDLRGLETID